MIEQFVSTLEKDESIPPIIIDENGCLDILTRITKKHLTSLDECRTGEFSNITLYEIPEDRKLFDVTTVRNCIQDISLIPYEKKQIYILRYIDKGTHAAMNALLKILEECPSYAIIILVVEDPETLLDTIHSRCINFYKNYDTSILSPEIKHYFDEFVSGNIDNFTRELHNGKLNKDEAIGLLRYAIRMSSGESIEKMEQAIIDIRMSHESPRNILDSIFFIPR